MFPLSFPPLEPRRALARRSQGLNTPLACLLLQPVRETGYLEPLAHKAAIASLGRGSWVFLCSKQYQVPRRER